MSSGLRRVPLRRYAPLRSRPVLLPDDVRRALESRSGGLCEVARADCLGAAAEAHHRVLRGSGGRHGSARQVSDLLSNLIHTCGNCHRWAHENRSAARDAGWTLGGRDMAALSPLLYRGEPAFLDEAGGVHSFDSAGA